MCGTSTRPAKYYRGEGYETPYQWARFDDIPFVRPSRPLSGCRVGMVTTSEMALVGEPGVWDDNPGCAVYALPTSTPVDQLYSKKESYDRYATTLDDVESYLPLTGLAECVVTRRIGSLAPRFRLCPRHRRAVWRPALHLQRFSARQPNRPAVRRPHATRGPGPGPRADRLLWGGGTRPQDDAAGGSGCHGGRRLHVVSARSLRGCEAGRRHGR